MNKEELKKRMDDVLIKGLFEDITKAERAYLQARTIGENCEAVNASDHWRIFEMCQVAFSDAQTMAIVRMFDKQTYPTRSICVILELMEKHGEDLEILQPDVLFDAVGEPAWQRPTLKDLDQPKLTSAFPPELLCNATDAPRDRPSASHSPAFAGKDKCPSDTHTPCTRCCVGLH